MGGKCHSQVLYIMVGSAMMTQWSAHAQNHRGPSTNLTLWSQKHNRRDLTLKYIAHITKFLVNFFNWISYSNPSHTCTNSQYLSHRTPTDLRILSMAMAALQKQMWRCRPQHSHYQLNNNYTGPHTYWSNELSAWYAGSQAHHFSNLTYLHYKWVNDSMLTGTTALPCHLITTISPEQTYFNVYQSYHCG